MPMLYVNGISLSVYHLKFVARAQDDLRKKQKELAELEKKLKSGVEKEEPDDSRKKRGDCPLCKKGVYSDELREFKDGSYYHDECIAKNLVTQDSATAVVSWLCTPELMSGGGGQELLEQPARAIEAYDLQVRGRACVKIS